jgi:serine protease Do
VRRAFLGISFGDIDPELASQFGLPVREGIIVTDVLRGSPADQAGLEPRDIITRINDTPVTRGGDLRRAIRALEPGATVRLAVLRPTGPTTLTARLGEVAD